MGVGAGTGVEVGPEMPDGVGVVVRPVSALVCSTLAVGVVEGVSAVDVGSLTQPTDMIHRQETQDAKIATIIRFRRPRRDGYSILVVPTARVEILNSDTCCRAGRYILSYWPRLPKTIRVGNGPKFTSKRLEQRKEVWGTRRPCGHIETSA